MEYFIVVIIVGVICGFVAQAIASSRGMSGGFLWGFFLGIIGIIVVAVRPKDQVSNESSSEEDIEDLLVPTTIYRFVCKECGKRSTGWYQVCPNCGASGKMERLAKEEKVIDEAKAAEIKAKQEERAAKKALEAAEKASHQSGVSISTADEIKKFKELADSGIISQDEFEAKKKQLLGI